MQDEHVEEASSAEESAARRPRCVTFATITCAFGRCRRSCRRYPSDAGDVRPWEAYGVFATTRRCRHPRSRRRGELRDVDADAPSPGCEVIGDLLRDLSGGVPASSPVNAGCAMSTPVSMTAMTFALLGDLVDVHHEVGAQVGGVLPPPVSAVG